MSSPNKTSAYTARCWDSRKVILKEGEVAATKLPTPRSEPAKLVGFDAKVVNPANAP
jgi:hypothetical protein